MIGLCGVILAGGHGTRLGELTRVTNKHLLPVGRYPMILHSLSKLVECGYRDIMIVTGKEHAGDFIELLGSGASYGCNLTYRVQDEAGGIAQALSLAEDFSCGNYTTVLLGDNIFAGNLCQIFDFHNPICNTGANGKAVITLKEVPDPGRYGVVEIVDNMIGSIEEKPKNPRSNLAVAGMYYYPPDVFDVIRTLEPSARGELEITDVNAHYWRLDRLEYRYLSGYWTDAGTHESLAEANRLVGNLELEF